MSIMHRTTDSSPVEWPCGFQPDAIRFCPNPIHDHRLVEQFEAFHNVNPDIYERLVKLARQARAAGRDRVSMSTLFEVLRWDVMILTVRDADDFRLNDHCQPFYTRLIEHREADLRGLFTARESVADRWIDHLRPPQAPPVPAQRKGE